MVLMKLKAGMGVLGIESDSRTIIGNTLNNGATGKRRSIHTQMYV